MNNKYFIVALSFLLAGTACTKELSQYPQTEKESSRFPGNETEAEEYVNATYANLQVDALYGLYLPALGELPSDNTYDEVPANDNGVYGELDLVTVSTSNTLIAATWQQSYKAIQKANTVLTRIEKITFASEVTKNARKGEMHFIRALLYFNLVRLFGDVPLVTEATTDPNVYFGQGRTAMSKVYDQIKQDLSAAVGELPATATQKGKVIKTAAQTLLAKVYLTLKDYSNARLQLLEVVNSGQHRLMASPADVFPISNENNAEIIFSVQFASGINGNSEGSTMFQQFSPSGTQTGAKGHDLPTRSLYNLYTDTDKRKGTYVAVTTGGVPYSRKLTKPVTVITDGGSDVVVLRYADVLLMLAETENELGNTVAAAPWLDSTRMRAGLLPVKVTDKEVMRQTIATERQLELVGEGHRWFDLLRTGTAISVMNTWFKSNNILTTIDDHQLLMPIPQGQVDTDPAIRQNPGYH